MAVIYRVVYNFNPNAVPTANLVVNFSSRSVAYKTALGNGKTATLTNAYQDDEGLWIVAAESSVMATLPTPQYTLDEVIDNDPGDWRAYRYALNEQYGHAKGFGDIPKGILVALSVGAPLPLAKMPAFLQGAGEIVGMQGSVPSSCGSMRATEIEAGTTYYGDTI